VKITIILLMFTAVRSVAHSTLRRYSACWLLTQVIKANARYHMSFFIIVIFMGSFYLVNLILAIVAMSYDDCRKQDQDAAEEELAVSATISTIIRELCAQVIMCHSQQY